MANNTTRGITYPTSGDSISPLETVFATLASTTDTAMGNLAATDITSGTLPITRGGTGGATASAALTSLGAVSSTDYANTAVFAGKNKLINGDFSIWQRASASSSQAAIGYFADRWRYMLTSGTSKVFSQSKQAFTPGTAPVSGYESKNFYRIAVTSAGSSYSDEVLEQPIEDVRSLAGQQVTISFWAKADTSRTITPRVVQYFGTGGGPSTSVQTTFAAQTVTTSWARYSATITVPSVTGKTIGTNDDSSLNVGLSFPVNTAYTIDIWGVQIEKSGTATAFSINGANQRDELASCQRYYVRLAATAVGQRFGMGLATGTSSAIFVQQFPTTMRAIPTTIETTGTATDYRILNSAGVSQPGGTVPVFVNATNHTISFTIGSTYTAAGNATVWASAVANCYLAWTAEL